MTISETGLVLGVDVGWSEKKKTTGVCALTWDRNTVTLQRERVGKDAEHLRGDLRRVTNSQTVLAVAIDGPLRGTLDEIGVYRDAEMMLTRGFQQSIGKPGQSSSPNGKELNRAANAVAQAVLSQNLVAKSSHQARIHDYAVVEAFPTSFLGVMLDEGQYPVSGARSDVYFEHLLGPDFVRAKIPKENRLVGLLRDLLPGREVQDTLAGVTDHEERAAIACAVTALCVAARRYVAVGDRRNGYIVLPPAVQAEHPGLQPWAMRILQKNRPAGSSDALISEPEGDGR
jgi:predicted RNase H-like nuclease